MEVSDRSLLIDKKWTRRNRHHSYSWYEIFYELYFFVIRYMVEFGSKYIEIEIEDAIFRGMMTHMIVDLVLVFYADYGSDES
jgi:hypothetical protein